MTGISASGALAYDAFQVLDSAFRKILKEKPFLFSNDNDIGKKTNWYIFLELKIMGTIHVENNDFCQKSNYLSTFRQVQ